MSSALVGIVLGNRADFAAIRKGLETLRVMGIPYEFELISSERTPDKAVRWAAQAAERGMEVLIAATGGTSGLAGLIAAHTSLPVVAVPIDSTPMRGEDALVAAAQSPPGAPVACVGINAGENAALLAARILALKHPHFNRVLQHQRQNAAIRQDTALQELRNQYPDLADPKVTAPEDPRLFITEMETDPGFLFREEEEEEAPRAHSAPPPSPSPPGSPSSTPGSPPLPSGTAAVAKSPTESSAPPQEPAPARASRDALLDETETDTPSPDDEATALSAPSGTATPGEPTPPPPATPGKGDDTEGLGERQKETNASGKPRKKNAGRKPDVSLLVPPGPNSLHRRPLADRHFCIAADSPDVDVIEHAMFTLLEGGLVAIPTDTVYGIAVDASNAEAVERLYRLKGRDRQKALAILCHNTEMLGRLVPRLPAKVEDLIEEFWPGSLTMIFPKPAGVLAGVSATKSIGVRIPDHNTTLALISMVCRPLATSSANLAGESPATTAEEVISLFGDDLDCILDVGPTPGTVASTVLSVVESPYRILREGAITRAALAKVLGELLAG